MKAKFFLAGLLALCLLTPTGSLQATVTNTVTVTANPKTAGEVIGGGKYTNGSLVTVTATATECYVFTDWTVGGKKIVNNPYSFTVTGNETLTANFTQIKYAISTSSSPENGGTVSGGGNIGCGDTATLTAKANTADGFAFSAWTSTLGPSPSNKYTFSVSGPESFVAHFKDIQAPKVAITAPANNEKITTSAFAIQGTSRDNVAVKQVSFSLNGGAAQPALTVNDFANWYAYVTLPPNSTNTVTAFAEDFSGNISVVTTPIKFTCTAAGYAPLSLAGQMAMATSSGATGPDPSFQVSFDPAVYVLVSDTTSMGGEVGTYTYTPTGPNTAELVPHRILPLQRGDTNTDVLEMTFTDAYNATYTDGTNGGGTFQFGAIGESVPTSLAGAALIATSSVTPNLISSNVLALGTFAANDNQGGSSAGSYTFTQFTPVAGLLMEISPGPTTNYIILSFNQGVTPLAGIYFSETAAGTNAINDVGSFTLSGEPIATKLVGPIVMDNLQAKITPTIEPTKGFFFTSTFGRGTFASMYLPPASDLSLFTNGPNDVGIRLGNNHINTNSGVATYFALDPPYADGMDDTVDEIWKSFTSGLSSNVVTGATATLKLSALKHNAPAALSGQAITFTPSGTTKTTTFTFNYNNVVATGEEAGLFGTYTYAPYTPTMALVQMTATDSANAGQVQYILLNFESTSGGAYVGSRFAGTWELKPGTFKLSK